jgi:hypothetical protein
MSIALRAFTQHEMWLAILSSLSEVKGREGSGREDFKSFY